MPVPDPPADPVADGRTSAVGSRQRTWLVAKDERVLAPQDVGAVEVDWLFEQLQSDPSTGARLLRPPVLTLQSAGPGASLVDQVLVATLPDETVAQLAGHPQVVIEEDSPLLPSPLAPPAALPGEATFVSPFGLSTTWDLSLQSFDGEPVADATVYLYGSGVPAQGRTDAEGRVSLTLPNESDTTLRALYVNPQRDYWSLWIDRPSLVAGQRSTVVLQSLAQVLPGFPQQQVLGWGQRAMRLDGVPSHLDGRGVKVAVVDSGAAADTHPDLRAAVAGVDLTGQGVHWTVDTIAHGSHCTGIIAGTDDGHGIRGFAPAAQVHEARIFTGGTESHLIQAIDYCMEQQIDVVNLSLGMGGTSQILLQKLAQAREQGVACIVAAGNSSGPVQFPGSSPDVLTVAAVGQEGTFPDNSYHARQRWGGGRPDGTLFAAQFSCHGPQVDVCGPGVAVVSAVPPDGYAAWDGTSMAAPHVAGLAALVLAHHPDFQTPALRLRTAARVDRLFALLRRSCSPVDVGDPERTGAGLPDALRALGLEDPPDRLDEGTATASVEAALEQVRQELLAAGLLDGDSPPVVQEQPASGTAVRRELAEVEALLRAAGLLPVAG